MKNIKLLLTLEENNKKLDKDFEKLDSLKEELKLEDAEKQLKRVKRRLEILENNKEIIKTCILKYENSLAQFEYEINTLNEKLYSDNITDIKQLEYLGFEKEQIKKKLKTVETEMIAYMEEDESIEEKHKENSSLLKELKEKLDQNDSDIKNNIESLEKKLLKQEKLIEEISEKIDVNLLKDYNGLRDRKDKPITYVIDNICSGCNMKLPSYQLEELKEKKAINCESCGRILCLKQD
nr:C4-type zinc ribbon domain-containing protein [Tissierella sp.]